jgi:cytochrome c556
MRKLWLAAAFLSIGAIGTMDLARAQGTAGGAAGGASVTVPATNLIMARQAGMDLQDGTLAAMKAAVQSKADVKQFKDSADALGSWGKAIPGLFVPGTDKGGNTKARPVVFTDQAGFAKAADNLSTAAAKLADAANADDKAAFATAFQQVGQACGGCHRTYRER